MNSPLLAEPPSSYQCYGLPEAANTYPRPRFSATPTLNLTHLQWLGNTTGSHYQSVFTGADALTFWKGRYAIASALTLLPADNSQYQQSPQAAECLLPAYHCPSMVEPALLTGHTPVFYPLTAELYPDLSQLEGLITPRTKAILITHFFGNVVDFSDVIKLAQKHNLVCIEDCSHAFGAIDSPIIPGTQGDTAITSTAKFFAGSHGGRMVINNPGLKSRQGPTHIPNITAELRDLKDIVTDLITPEPHSDSDTQSATALALPGQEVSANTPVDFSGPEFIAPIKSTSPQSLQWCNKEDDQKSNSRLLNLVVKLSNIRAAANRRRELYQALRDDIVSMSHLSLFEPGGTPDIPYCLPLLLHDSNRQFHQLKQMGVPVWRWEELAISDCPTAMKLRSSLIQIPCHEGITPKQLTWLIQNLRAIG